MMKVLEARKMLAQVASVLPTGIPLVLAAMAQGDAGENRWCVISNLNPEELRTFFKDGSVSDEPMQTMENPHETFPPN